MAIVRAVALAVMLPFLVLGPAAFVGWQAKKEVSFWHENYQYHKDQYVYYFEGANKRGLLDICPDDSGRPSVRFKEDCK